MSLARRREKNPSLRGQNHCVNDGNNYFAAGFGFGFFGFLTSFLTLLLPLPIMESFVGVTAVKLAPFEPPLQ